MNKISLLIIAIFISSIANAQWQLIDDNVAGGTAKRTQIEIAPDGIVYVSYQKYYSGSYELRVKKYDGNAWTEITNEPLAAGSYENSLRISEDGTLYILFVDEEISSGNGTGKASCMKYNGGTNWEYVGDLGSINNRAEYIDLALDQNQQPWISYSNVFSSYNVSVYQYVNPATTYTFFLILLMV